MWCLVHVMPSVLAICRFVGVWFGSGCVALFSCRVSVVCLGALLVLVLLFGCLLCLLVYLVLVTCASWAALLVGGAVVLDLLVCWFGWGVIAAICLSCLSVFGSGGFVGLVGLIVLVVGLVLICLGGLAVLFIGWSVCLFCWVSFCECWFIMTTAIAVVGGCIVFNSVGRAVLCVFTFVVGGCCFSLIWLLV